MIKGERKFCLSILDLNGVELHLNALVGEKRLWKRVPRKRYVCFVALAVTVAGTAKRMPSVKTHRTIRIRLCISNHSSHPRIAIHHLTGTFHVF